MVEIWGMLIDIATHSGFDLSPCHKKYHLHHVTYCCDITFFRFSSPFYILFIFHNPHQPNHPGDMYGQTHPYFIRYFFVFTQKDESNPSLTLNGYSSKIGLLQLLPRAPPTCYGHSSSPSSEFVRIPGQTKNPHLEFCEVRRPQDSTCSAHPMEYFAARNWKKWIWFMNEMLMWSFL